MSHKPVGGAGGRAQRAQEIGLFRYGLIRPVADPGLTTRQRGRVGLAVADRRHQGVEAAGPPGPDPPVQGDPRYPDPVTERTHVVLFGELAHPSWRTNGPR